jgi:cold shock CspA family protein
MSSGIVDSGVVMFVAPTGYYGYIAPDDGDRNVIYYTADGPRDLKVGHRVLFGYVVDGRQVRATNLIRPCRPRPRIR